MRKVKDIKDKFIYKANKKLYNFSKQISVNLPKSEEWFMDYYKDFKDSADIFNVPINDKYIPDVSNKKYRYVIEIDGSIHDLPEIKAKDQVKQKYYQSKCIDVYRIKAYDNKQLVEVVQKIVNKRKKLDKKCLTFYKKSGIVIR